MEVMKLPSKPLKPCRHPQCPELTSDRYCDKHKKENTRLSYSRRGYGSRWRKARSRFLKSNSLCVKCKEAERLTEATVVDHIIPHRGDKTLFWDESNRQALYKSCHDTKTMQKIDMKYISIKNY